MKSSLFFPRILCAFVICLAANSASMLQAQVGTPDQASAAALELFNRGQTADAVAAYEKILKDYPTAVVVSEAQFRLGYLRFLQGELDQSIEILGKVMVPPAPQEIQELAGSMLPQAMSAKAAKMSPDDPKRTAAFEAAIKQFDAFIQKYPTNAEVESAIYGKSLAQYQIKKYDEAVNGLRQNMVKFAKSESILDSEYLLGVTLASQENDKDAEKCFRNIIEKRTDLALANEAQFQLAEILFNRAIKSTGKPENGAMYAKAIEAYQAVKSKDLVVKAQQARMAGFMQGIREAGMRHDIAAVKTIQRLRTLETAKIAAMAAKPETAIAAQVKIGMCDFQLQKYGEASAIFLKAQALTQDDLLKKQILYYLALSYASENLVDKAVSSYEEFQSKYKGDPIADNLPVAIGAMFLNASRTGDKTQDGINQEKAVQYFKEAQQIYPNGQFTAQALLQQAGVLLQLRRFEDAQKGYQDFLATKPKPEQAAAAELGLAGINKETGKMDEALAGYKSVVATYPTLPEAEQAAFWVAQLTLLKGDSKTAITLMSAFLANYPESVMRPSAMFALAQAEQATGAKDKALADFKELAEKYPQSEAAPFAYFQLAGIYASDQKVEDMVGAMKTFIEKYPTNDKIYYAFDTIGQSEINAGKVTEALETYSKMAAKYPENAQAPEALLKVETLWLHYSRSQGLYTALNDEQRVDWNKGVTNSLETAGTLLQKYPNSQPVALALQTLLDAQKMLVTAKLKTDSEVEKYFQELAEKCAGSPALKSKVLFKLAAYLYEKDKASALVQMNAAYDPKLLYAPNDIDLYGGALIESGKLDEAQRVFEKLAADNPVPQPGGTAQAPPQVQEAQAIAIYGIGKTLQKQGKIAEAGVKFDELKKVYPWSPKILEADFGIAQALAQQKKLDEASNLLVQIIRAQTATAELRANSMLLGGDIQSEKGNLEAAIDYYIKIATFYEGVPSCAAEGLWKGGQLLEKQAAGLTETSKPTKAAQLAKARQAFKDLTEKYPSAPFAAQAKAKLQRLELK